MLNNIVHLRLGLPQECLPVLKRCIADKLLDTLPDQLTVNQYESGQGEGLQLLDYSNFLMLDTFSDSCETQYNNNPSDSSRCVNKDCKIAGRVQPKKLGQKASPVAFTC